MKWVKYEQNANKMWCLYILCVFGVILTTTLLYNQHFLKDDRWDELRVVKVEIIRCGLKMDNAHVCRITRHDEPFCLPSLAPNQPFVAYTLPRACESGSGL